MPPGTGSESDETPDREHDSPSQPPSEPDWDSAFDEIAAQLRAAPPVSDEAYLVGDTPRSGAGVGPRDYVAEPEDDDDVAYVPELTTGTATDPVSVIGWSALVGGALGSLLLLIFWPQATRLVTYALVAAFLTGAGIILWRLPARRSDPDDDGAQV